MPSIRRALAAGRRRLKTSPALGSARSTNLEQLSARVAELESQSRLLESLVPAMAWIEQATLAAEPLVSVVMPTRNRAGVLPRALDSVLAQDYENWELVIVDDGSQDGTAELLASLDDQRIRCLRAAGDGESAARNRALEQVRGEIVTYLDDDNTMHPMWLKSVVWAFEQRPESDVLYGVFAVDDGLRLLWVSSGAWPSISLNPYDHETLTERSLTDISVTAHRSGLAEAQFDETLVTTGDWDLLGRLTVDKPPLVLPVIASFYYTSAAGRLSESPLDQEEAERVRRKLRRMRGAGPGSVVGA